MLPSSRRISRAQFPIMGKLVRVCHSQLCSVRIYRLRENSLSKAVVSISKKEAKKAVERNRLKRRYYEALHTFIHTLPKGTGVQVLVKSPSIGKPIAEITSTLVGLVR